MLFASLTSPDHTKNPEDGSQLNLFAMKGSALIEMMGMDCSFAIYYNLSLLMVGSLLYWGVYCTSVVNFPTGFCPK